MFKQTTNKSSTLMNTLHSEALNKVTLCGCQSQRQESWMLGGIMQSVVSPTIYTIGDGN